MTIKQFVKHFGGVPAASRETGIPQGTIRQWIARGKIPKGRQYEIAAHWPELKVSK